jgi:hypothetical protein
MEEKSKREKHFDIVENCRFKLAFVSDMASAVFHGGERQSLTDFGAKGLAQICEDIREQLGEVEDYLERSE